MEKIKLDLRDLREEVIKLKYDTEKINLLLFNMPTCNNSETTMVSDMITDYTIKIRKVLENIESILTKEVKNNG